MCCDALCIGTAALKRCVHFFHPWNLKDASHESFVFTASTLGIRSLARKLRFHFLRSCNLKDPSHESLVFTSSTLGNRFHVFRSCNLKEASHESFVFTNQGCDLNVIGFHETFCFPVNGASVEEKSWPACATGADVVALAWNCCRTARWN